MNNEINYEELIKEIKICFDSQPTDRTSLLYFVRMWLLSKKMSLNNADDATKIIRSLYPGATEIGILSKQIESSSEKIYKYFITRFPSEIIDMFADKIIKYNDSLWLK